MGVYKLGNLPFQAKLLIFRASDFPVSGSRHGTINCPRSRFAAHEFDRLAVVMRVAAGSNSLSCVRGSPGRHGRKRSPFVRSGWRGIHKLVPRAQSAAAALRADGLDEIIHELSRATFIEAFTITFTTPSSPVHQERAPTSWAPPTVPPVRWLPFWRCGPCGKGGPNARLPF
jgi:hypothetical protein